MTCELLFSFYRAPAGACHALHLVSTIDTGARSTVRCMTYILTTTTTVTGTAENHG